MKYKSIEEIKNSNLAQWEKDVMIENFKFKENLSDVGKLILELNGVKL